MNGRPTYSTLVVAALACFWVAGCLCGSGGDGDSGGRMPEPRMDVDDRFVTDAKANGWYIGGGAFTQLWGEFDTFWLPDPGAETPMELAQTHHFGSWDLSKDNLIVAETEDRDPSTKDTPNLKVMDLDLNIVWQDETKKHFEIYSDYRWSPDGKMISYAHGTQIYIIDWETKEARSIAVDHKAVVRDGPLYATPSWAPDSKRLTYQTTEDEVAIIDVTTKDKTFLGTGAVPAWSPDGKTIAALQKEKLGGTKTMLAYDTESKEKRVLFETDFTIPYQPVWTPDSKYLLFHRPKVNSIYGWLYFYDVAEKKFYSTGKEISGLRDAQVVKLPGQYLSKLSLRKNNDTENPNRRPR